MPPAKRLPRALALLLLLPCLAAAAGRDGDGLEDAAEQALLERFAPVVLLAPGERALPANVDWFLERAALDAAPAPAPRMTQASLLGVDLAALARRVSGFRPRLRPTVAARAGSADPREWLAYGHVYPARDGGLLLQYWFFYPFNDFHLLFDHEGDWEHVTVRLDPARRPAGAWYARHDWSAPGRWFPWDALKREGEHPVALSARGSHASYATLDDVRFYDRTCPTRDPSRAAAAGCTVWRTWGAEAGGVVATGPRERPRARARFVAWPGEWGTLGWLHRDSGGPRGPAYQAGWCAEGREDCS
jgi:hypothetical protein